MGIVVVLASTGGVYLVPELPLEEWVVTVGVTVVGSVNCQLVLLYHL